MTEKTSPDTSSWKSERFAKEIANPNSCDHYYEDDDPRIRIVTDQWGDEVIIIGYTDELKLPVPLSDGTTALSEWVIGIRILDNCLCRWHPNAIDQKQTTK